MRNRTGRYKPVSAVGIALFLSLSLVFSGVGSISVLADSGEYDTQTVIAAVSADLEDEGIDAIAITVIVPPAHSRSSPPSEARRLFPVNVAEGYNYEGVRELIRIYELLPNESPEWINTESFQRNGYYYQIAEIIRRVDIAHTSREHTEIIEIQTERNDLAAVIAGLNSTMDFVDEDGYVGVLHLNINSIEMTQDGTRSTSRTVSQTREYPHLSNPDISLIPQTVTANGRTYTLSNVDWRTNTANPIDYNSVAQTFTAHATYTRTATNTVSTGYTTRVEYTGTLTRVSTGDTRFVATFIGTPIVGPIIHRPISAPDPSREEGQVTNGNYNGVNGTNNEQAENHADTPIMAEIVNGEDTENPEHYNGHSVVNGMETIGAETAPQPTNNNENGNIANNNDFCFLSFLPFIMLLLMAAGILALVVMMLKFKKKADALQEKIQKDSANAVSSRMASIIEHDRREIGGRAGGRFVRNIVDDMDFEETETDEDENMDYLDRLDEELDYEEKAGESIV